MRGGQSANSLTVAQSDGEWCFFHPIVLAVISLRQAAITVWSLTSFAASRTLRIICIRGVIVVSRVYC